MASLPLPPALTLVEVGRFVSPSVVAGAEDCLLRGVHGLPETDQLPPHASAVLGSIVHDTMNAQARRGGSPTWPEVYTSFIDRVEARERELAADPRTRGIVPLRSGLDLGLWSDRVAYLRSWLEAGGASGRGSTTPEEKAPREHHQIESDTTVVPGSEIWLQVSALRLRGRVDRIESDGEGVLIITDFKTGSIRRDGELRREYVLQVQLYGHMVETLEPGTQTRLFLEGKEQVEVPWTPSEHAQLEDYLQSVLHRLPEGQPIEADSLATPGVWCRWCDIRHRCRNYLQAAPRWWAGRSAGPETIPLDVWGEVTGIEREDGGKWRVKLRDPSGARVHVDGLSPERDLEVIRAGQRMWFFDLVSGEEGRSSRERPRNFRENAGGQSTSLFVSS